MWSPNGEDSDEDCLNGSPSIILLIGCYIVQGNTLVVVRRSYCSARVGAKNVRGANKDSQRWEIVERLMFEVIASSASMFPGSPANSTGRSISYTENKPRRKSRGTKT